MDCVYFSEVFLFDVTANGGADTIDSKLTQWWVMQGDFLLFHNNLLCETMMPIQQLHFLNGRLWLVPIVNENVYSLVEIDFRATLTGHFTSDTLLVSGWTCFGSQNLFNSL